MAVVMAANFSRGDFLHVVCFSPTTRRGVLLPMPNLENSPRENSNFSEKAPNWAAYSGCEERFSCSPALDQNPARWVQSSRPRP